MATICRNCGYQLVFDPKTQKLECEACGSSFDATEVEAGEKEYRENEIAESMEQVYGARDKDYIDCYIYTCSHCGGEIIINGTEASSNCIYCGNSNVVFSRITREKRPKFIIPFSIGKEQAVQLIHQRIDKGFFIPDEIKHFKPDNVRGIYIPYWLVDVAQQESMLVSAKVKSGRSSTTRYFGRAGKIKLKDLPLDASRILSDESSERLEPYDLNKIKDFDEDYLNGYYSNISDVRFADIEQAAERRATEYFEDSVLKEVPGSDKKIVYKHVSSVIDYTNLRYGMLPAWFVTFKYQGKQNTILVNGSTGKVVCGLPWKKGLFWALIAISSVILTIIATIVFYYSFGLIFGFSNKDNRTGELLVLLVIGITILLINGINKIKKVCRNIERTQSSDIYNFVKKRQG